MKYYVYAKQFQFDANSCVEDKIIGYTLNPDAVIPDATKCFSVTASDSLDNLDEIYYAGKVIRGDSILDLTKTNPNKKEYRRTEIIGLYSSQDEAMNACLNYECETGWYVLSMTTGFIKKLD